MGQDGKLWGKLFFPQSLKKKNHIGKKLFFEKQICRATALKRRENALKNLSPNRITSNKLTRKPLVSILQVQSCYVCVLRKTTKGIVFTIDSDVNVATLRKVQTCPKSTPTLSIDVKNSLMTDVKTAALCRHLRRDYFIGKREYTDSWSKLLGPIYN